MTNDKASERERIEAVTRMQNYIKAHLREPITQGDLSRAAGYSEYYAARMFKELTGKAPFEYIRKLRLSQSAVTLREEKPKVIDVAFDYVFGSHEGFTRAFAKEFGITPKEYAGHPKALKLFLPSNVKEFCRPKTNRNEEKAMSEVQGVIFVQVVDRPARKMILKRGKKAAHYFEYCEEVGCDVWETLSAIKGTHYEPMGLWMPDNLRSEGTSVYAQGVEVPFDWKGELPEGFELIELAPCKLLVFQGPPYDDDKFEEAIDALWKETERYNPAIYGFEWDDTAAPRFQLEPQGYRGYIEGRPVREVNR